MALLGKAALAMWWDMAAEVRPDFEDWHSHEHFPERMGKAAINSASEARNISSRPPAGENRTVSACPATPPPALASTRHWLRTMWRWCGIMRVDHGVGWFSRAR